MWTDTVHRVRRALLLSLATVLSAAVPATAAAPTHISIPRFDLLQVNQVVVHVKPGGSHPLCQAIPITAIRVRVKWSDARGLPRAVVTLKAPGEHARSRNITLAGSSDTEPVEFTPRGAFHGGTYKATVTLGGRKKASASFKLTQATKTC